MLSELFGQAVPTILGMVFACLGLTALTSGVVHGWTYFSVAGGVAFVVGILFLWICRGRE